MLARDRGEEEVLSSSRDAEVHVNTRISENRKLTMPWYCKFDTEGQFMQPSLYTER